VSDEKVLCDQCGEREVAVRVTHVVDGEAREVKLCDRCAAERGIQTSASITQTPLGGFLHALWKTADPGPAELGASGPCPTCGATFADFRESGRLGCADCYVAFEGQLRILIRRYHGSTHHHGRRHVGPAAGGEQPAEDRARGLREQLRLAVSNENFELAAELRDRLKELER
jgi:protein arginine kinase activator